MKNSQITIKDVAKVAHVSPATVSRVLNHTDEVTLDIRKKVDTAINYLGYKPNHVARALVNRRANFIGVIVNNLHDPFFADLIRGFEEGAQQTSYNVIFGSIIGQDIKRKEKYIDYMIHGVVDGIILYGSYLEDSILLQYINNGTIDFVMIENNIGEAKCNKLLIKNSAGVKSGIDYLIKKGHRKIAYLGGNPNRRVMTDRLNGYLESMHRATLEIYNGYIQYVVTPDYEAVFSRIKAILQLSGSIDALFCADDALASYAISSIQQMGLEVPHDISVMGFDNRSILPNTYRGPLITTIAQPLYQIGYDSIEILINQIDSKDSKLICREYDTEIIEKESVKNIAG